MIGQFWRDVVNDIYDSISFLFLMQGRYVRFGCCVIVVPSRLLHSAGSCRNLVQILYNVRLNAPLRPLNSNETIYQSKLR